MSDQINICAVCKVPASQICAGCKSVFYCNREHQKKHWKEGHKTSCCCYKTIVSDQLGAHLIATRDIKQNEVILKDTPIVVGPARSTCLMCIGCNKNIRIQGESNNIYRCKNCNWPLCGKHCQESKLHKNECAVMKDKFTPEDLSNIAKKITTIGPLRCLLLKSTNKSKYDTLNSLPVPNPSKDQLEQIKTIVVPFIQTVNLPGVEENDIINVCSTYDLLSFDISKDEGNVQFRALFPVAALLKHRCRPNTKYTIHGDNNQMLLMSTTHIPKGALITTTHAETLWGTLTRRSHLLETRNFVCECERCGDSTELGTYLGAIFCCKCKREDEVACPKMLSTDALNAGAVWKCEKCDHTIRGRQMVWGNEAIKSEMNRIDKRIPLNLEKFLVKYKETLHPKNYHALVAKFALSQIYGNSEGYQYSDLTDEIVERKIDICHELLEVLDVLDPGCSKVRGTVLYELQAAMVVLTKREFNKGKLTKTSAQDKMMECLVFLKEATQILSSEPGTKEFLKDQLEKFSKDFEFDD